jgi:hypothetical protein
MTPRFPQRLQSTVVGSEVVSKTQVVDDVQVGLSGGSGKVVVAAGVLSQYGIDQV